MLTNIRLGKVSQEKELMAYRDRSKLINLLAYVQLGAKRIEVRNDLTKTMEEFWIEIIDSDLVKVNNVSYYFINGFYYDFGNKELVLSNEYENTLNDFQNGIYTAEFENNNLQLNINYSKEKENNHNFILTEYKLLKNKVKKLEEEVKKLEILKEENTNLKKENKTLKNENIKYLSALNEMADTLIKLNQVQ